MPVGVSVAPTLQQQKCGQFCHLQFCECPRLNRRFRRLEASSSIPPRSWWRHAATKQPVLPDQFSKSDSLDLEVLGNHRPRLVMLLCVPAQLLLQRSWSLMILSLLGLVILRRGQSQIRGALRLTGIGH